MVKVIFVCLGNICRSPMAEAIFSHLVAEAGLSDQIEIDSAATSPWEIGKTIHEDANERLQALGIPTPKHVARQLDIEDIKADYIIGMDEPNLRAINYLIGARPSGEVNMLLHYAGEETQIADPWYTEDFDTAFSEIYRGCQALLAHIQSRHSFNQEAPSI